MNLSLGDLCSTASAFAGGRGDLSLSEVSRYVNIAYGEVAQVYGHRPPQAIAVSSTTSGENRYATPSDFDAVLAFTLFQPSSTTTGSRTTNAIPLVARDAAWADSFSLPNSGVPANYVNYGSAFELYPSPNSAYSLQLRYVAKLPVLVASTDTVALDDRWGPAVAMKAAEYLCAARADVEGEALGRNRYVNYVSQVPTDQQLAQRDKRSMALRFGRNSSR